MNVYGAEQADELVTGLRAQGRDGEATPILSSPLFLLRNWSGIRQSPGTHLLSSYQCQGQTGGDSALQEGVPRNVGEIQAPGVQSRSRENWEGAEKATGTTEESLSCESKPL